MSTRANIVITDGETRLFFYRHSDGYLEGTMPTLKRFVDLVDNSRIRSNPIQASGWLILIGAEEYGVSLDGATDWKVGAYEPTDALHDDIEFLYVVNLSTCRIEVLNKFAPTTKDLNLLIKKSSAL